MVGDPHQQEADVAGHRVSMVRKQRDTNVDRGNRALLGRDWRSFVGEFGCIFSAS